MLKLNKLKKLVKKSKVIGRGGGRGGTSGRGHKGQKARSGGTIHSRFEGGQMPLSRRLPKRGFNNYKFKTIYKIVSLSDLNNKFENNSEISKENFIEKFGFKNFDNIKILNNGKLTKKFLIKVDACSASAKVEIEKLGGKVDIIRK